MAERKSIAELISETPALIIGLVKAEIGNLKAEVAGKAKGIGIGGALLAVAGFFALYMLGWLFAAIFEAYSLFAAPWLAALLVAATIFILIAILAIVGIVLIQRNKDFNNLQSVGSIKDDVNVVRGLGHAADGSDPLDDLPTPKNGTAQ